MENKELIEVEPIAELANDILQLLQDKYSDKNSLEVLFTLYVLTESISEELGIPVEVFDEQQVPA